MKKKAILFLGVICGLSLHAQENEKALGLTNDMSTPRHQSIEVNKSKTNAVIWSEDFSGGLPAGWTNTGSSANALWEYRGPSTTPDITTGSRGAYAGSAVITSPTASNGFMIFDSDFLDNNGDPNNMGGGVAPAPHVGILKTGTIDLSGHPNVQLKLYSYMRYFAGRTLIAFSTNGGTTFSDTVRLHSGIAVNGSSTTNALSQIDISPYVGGSSNVVLAFIYDGAYTEPAANGLGYYYWMMDDIEISTLPDNMFLFTPWNGAPANDMIYGNSGDPKYGHMTIENVIPVSFDANVVNFGVKDQVNVQLEVEILRDGVVETVLNSSAMPILPAGDTATYVDLYTPQFTPTQTGMYQAVFRVLSDSIPSQAGSVTPRDTSYTFYVTDTVSSLDFGFLDNTIGTPQLGLDGSAIASLIAYDNPTPSDPNTTIDVNSVDVYFSTATVPGGDVQVEIYDSTGFDYTAGFGSNALASVPFTVDATYPGTFKRLPITASLPADGGYYFVVYMFSNGGANEIRLGNDQSVDQTDVPVDYSIMYSTDDGRWWSGYGGGSRSFESPLIRVNAIYSSDTTNNDTTQSINEFALADFSVYPNPTNGSDVTVEVKKGGTYTLSLMNTMGEVVRRSEIFVNGSEELHMDYSAVASGIYLLELKGEEGSKTVRLTIN